MAQHRRNFTLVQLNLLGVLLKQRPTKNQTANYQQGCGQDGRTYFAIGRRGGFFGLFDDGPCASHSSVRVAILMKRRKGRLIG